MPEGTMVVKARLLKEVALSSQWYEKQPKGRVAVFWLRHVLDTDLITQPYDLRVKIVPLSGTHGIPVEHL
jgi:hypothetical protein